MATEEVTPGPWAVGRSSGSYQTVICRDATLPVESAIAFTVVREGHSFAEAEANAALIAAAPDLLAELRNIATANYRTWEVHGTPQDFVDWAQSRARAAIAKYKKDET